MYIQFSLSFPHKTKLFCHIGDFSPCPIEAFDFKRFYLMANYSKQFLKQTIEEWQPHSRKLLTLEDAREITDNMVNLYSYLNELNEKYGKEEKNI